MTMVMMMEVVAAAYHGMRILAGDTATVKRASAAVCDCEGCGERDHYRCSGADDEFTVFRLACDRCTTHGANGTANDGSFGVPADHLADRGANGSPDCDLLDCGRSDAVTLQRMRQRRHCARQGIGP